MKLFKMSPLKLSEIPLLASLRSSGLVLTAFAALAFAYIAFAFILPTRSVWISDEGNRILSVKSFADGASGALPNPASAIDGKLSSYPPPYFYEDAKGSVRSGYSQFFPMLTAPAFKLGGIWGLRLVPLLAGLLCAALAGAIASELEAGQKEQALSILAAGLCSPLAFYSFVALEITAAVALWSLSTFLLLRMFRASWGGGFRLAFVAGLLAGAAALFREESLVGMAAVLAALAFCRTDWRRLFAFAAGAALLTAPLLLFNLHESGCLFGMHAKIYAALNQGHGLFGRLAAAPGNVWFFLLKPHFDSALPSILCVLPILFATWAGLRGSLQLRTLALGLCLLPAAACFSTQALNPELMESTLRHQSLLESLPLAMIPLLFGRELLSAGEAIGLRFIAISTGLILFGVAAMLDAKSAGIFWGARHFALITPQLCALALCLAWRFKPGLPHWGALGLVAFSLLAQLNGNMMLLDKKLYSERFLEALPQTGVVATDVFWLPEEFASDQPGRTVAYIKNPSDLVRLAEACKSKGIPSFTLVMSPLFSSLPPESRKWLLQNAEIKGEATFKSQGLSFLELQAFTCLLK